MVEVGSVVSTWDDMAVLVRYMEMCLSQMGFGHCGPVRITVGRELLEPKVRALYEVELPFEECI